MLQQPVRVLAMMHATTTTHACHNKKKMFPGCPKTTVALETILITFPADVTAGVSVLTWGHSPTPALPHGWPHVYAIPYNSPGNRQSLVIATSRAP